ncbi:MAG: cysteine dioxygenase family protein [Actinomycetota bacterium]|jgi:predicted metal-dependent enzyme (double-stranded beta helix superfamily)|nr:cysteine dioxygenase family protein [Actinomycetota bacterium]
MTSTLGTTAPYVLPPEPTLRDAIPVLSRLVRDPEFLETRVPSLLEEARRATGWYVAYRHDAPDGDYSLQIFVWPPGTATEVHDHCSWGAFCCVAGSVLEERYERTDDGSVPGHARLRKLWRLEWSRADGISTVLPYGGGIHRVGNPTEEPAISVHLYGPRLGEIDERDYDPSQTCVCDRTEGR